MVAALISLINTHASPHPPPFKPFQAGYVPLGAALPNRVSPTREPAEGTLQAGVG